MSVIEKVTVTRWRVKDPPKEWRRRGLRATRAVAYRDAAWAKIRSRCTCTHVDEPGGVNAICRYHDKEYRVTPEMNPRPWEELNHFEPPRIWGLPRSDDAGFWDYGRAVAFRLARFYAHLDRRAPVPAESATKGEEDGR